MGMALHLDKFLVSDSGAYAGVATLHNEDGNDMPLEGDFKTAGNYMKNCTILGGVAAVLAMVTMFCNMLEYHHRLVQASSVLSYLVMGMMLLGTAGYEYYSKDARYDERYNTQVDRYVIQRDWRWGASYMSALAVSVLSIVGAIFSFCSTPEAVMCETDPCVACKMCCFCQQKKFKVQPYEVPLPPSKGGRALPT